VIFQAHTRHHAAEKYTEYRINDQAANAIVSVLSKRISQGNINQATYKQFEVALESLFEEHHIKEPEPSITAAPFVEEPVYTLADSEGKSSDAATFDFGDGVEVILSEKGDISPIGGTVWEAGLVMSSYLKDMEWEYFGWLSGKRFVDLGTGTGLCGIMAWKFGATGLMTDQNRLSEDGTSLFDLIQENIKLNADSAVQIGESREDTLQRAQVCELSWGQPLSKQVLAFAKEAPLDLIICADLLYQKTAHLALLDTILDLATPGTTVLVSYVDRGGQEEGFARRLQHSGFNIQYIIEDHVKKIFLFSATLAGSTKGQ